LHSCPNSSCPAASQVLGANSLPSLVSRSGAQTEVGPQLVAYTQSCKGTSGWPTLDGPTVADKIVWTTYFSPENSGPEADQIQKLPDFQRSVRHHQQQNQQ